MYRKRKGQVTVWLALTFLVFLSLYLICLESVQKQSARRMAEQVAESSLFSLFSEYEPHLLEQYDLFYLDTSFRSGKENRDELCSHLWKFTEDNLKRAQGGDGTEFTDERDRGQRLCQGHGRRWKGLLSAGGPGYERADRMVSGRGLDMGRAVSGGIK